jgi:hypothetical protein
LRKKLEKRGLGEVASSGTIVGLAPGKESFNYEGYTFWDAGILWLTTDKLYYIGEQTQFVLDRSQVGNVYTEDANAEWLSHKNLFLEWQKDGEQEKQTLYFVAIEEGSVWQSRRAIDLLLQRLKSWRQQTIAFPSGSEDLESIVGPALPEIPSAPPIPSFNATAIVVAAFQLSFYAFLVGFALGLSFASIRYVMGVVLVGTFLDGLPQLLRKRKVTIDSRVEPASYEPGSWADERS